MKQIMTAGASAGIPLIGTASGEAQQQVQDLTERVEHLESTLAEMADGYAVLQRLLMTKGITLQQLQQATSQLMELQHFVGVLREIVYSSGGRLFPQEPEGAFDFPSIFDVFLRIPKSYRPVERSFYLTVSFISSAKTVASTKLYLVVGTTQGADAVLLTKPKQAETKGEIYFNIGMLHLVLRRQAGVGQAFGADLCGVRHPEHVAKWFQLFNWQAVAASYASVIPQEESTHGEGDSLVEQAT